MLEPRSHNTDGCLQSASYVVTPCFLHANIRARLAAAPCHLPSDRIDRAGSGRFMDRYPPGRQRAEGGPELPACHAYYNGGVVPLWDGTHRLEDSSVMIVRDGQAVPTESMMNSWIGEPGSEPSMRTRYCDPARAQGLRLPRRVPPRPTLHPGPPAAEYGA